MSYPLPIPESIASSLCRSWQDHKDAEQARFDFFSSEKETGKMWQEVAALPEYLVFKERESALRDAGHLLSQQIHANYPWVDIEHRIGMGVSAEEIRKYLIEGFRDATKAALAEEHALELAELRAYLASKTQTELAPSEGWVFVTRRQQTFRVTRDSHKGSRVFGKDRNSEEIRLLPGAPAEHLRRAEGYIRISEKVAKRFWQLEEIWHATLAAIQPFAP